MGLHVTAHAIVRFQQRVSNVSEDIARQALSSTIIQRAAEFGAHYVRLGTGQRVVIDQGKVITVLPANHRPGSMSMERSERFKARRDDSQGNGCHGIAERCFGAEKATQGKLEGGNGG